MNKTKVWLPMICLVTVVVLALANLVFAYTQRQQRIAAGDVQQLVTQQVMEQEAAQQAAEKEKIAAEAAAQAASIYEIVPLPTPKPTPKPSPKPQENSTITGPDGDVVVNQPEYAKPTPPPAPTPSPTPGQTPPPQPTEPTPTPKPQPSQPKDGDRNDKGQIYIGGFGWLDPPAGTDMGSIDNSGWEDSPQIGF